MTTATATTHVATIADFQESWSDLHKDAYGFRPRYMPEYTLAQWQAEFDRLGAICDANRVEREREQAAAIVKFDDIVADLINRGASDRAMAIRWLHDAHSTNGDSEYLCYVLGLPYGHFSSPS